MQTDIQTETARFNMIEQQIRPWDVLDPVVLALLQRIPREDFVPAQYAGLAFADIEIPLGYGQTMLSPKVEGRILQGLQIKADDRVLEIGTGSGYLTALLASAAREVVSVELHAALSQQAAKRLQAYPNVQLRVGDASQEWNAEGPYDVIVYTGSLALPPTQALASLKPGGRLFAVIGEVPVMHATLFRRLSDATDIKREVLFETCLPMLAHAPQPEKFQF